MPRSADPPHPPSPARRVRRQDEPLPPLNSPASASPEELGHTLRAARTFSKLSLNQLAVMAESSRAELSQIERGRILAPKRALLQRIESALNLVPGALTSLVPPSKSPRHPHPSPQLSWFSRQSQAEVLQHLHGELTALKPPDLLRRGWPTTPATVVKDVDRDPGRALLAIAYLLSLVHHVPAASPDPTPTVIITGHCNIELVALDDHLLHQRWIDALRGLVAKGWTIAHMVRPVPRNAAAVSLNLLHLFPVRGPQGYIPYYLPDGEGLEDEREYILVPGKGIIEYGVIDEDTSANRAPTPPPVNGLRIWPPAQTAGNRYDALAERLTGILRRSRPLAVPYTDRQPDFTRAMARTDRHTGPRGLFLDSVSELFVADAIHRERGQRLVEQGQMAQEEVEIILQSRHARLEYVLDHLKARTVQVRDLYPKRAIQRLVEQRVFSLEEAFTLHENPQQLSDKQVIMVLDTMLRILKEYETFELNLADDDPRLPPDRQQWPCFWLVKKGHAVLLESLCADEYGHVVPMELEIVDRLIADEFYTIFESLWDQLPGIKARDAVTAFLRAQRVIVSKRIQKARNSARARARRAEREPSHDA